MRADRTRVLRTIAALTAALFLGVPGALAQSAEQSKRINEWFERNKPKEWNPKVGEIQKSGEIQKAGAVEKIKEQCRDRLLVGSDVLFEFDKASLTSGAEDALGALEPMIREAGKKPITVEGHTDAIGGVEYNLKLSERRARAVKEWLVVQKMVPDSTPVKGWGKSKPVASNIKPDGSDDPEGRRKNRRVEVVVNTCG